MPRAIVEAEQICAFRLFAGVRRMPWLPFYYAEGFWHSCCLKTGAASVPKITPVPFSAVPHVRVSCFSLHVFRRHEESRVDFFSAVTSLRE